MDKETHIAILGDYNVEVDMDTNETTICHFDTGESKKFDNYIDAVDFVQEKYGSKEDMVRAGLHRTISEYNASQGSKIH